METSHKVSVCPHCKKAIKDGRDFSDWNHIMDCGECPHCRHSLTEAEVIEVERTVTRKRGRFAPKLGIGSGGLSS